MSDTQEKPNTEYNDERDMDRFWSVANSLRKEPLRQKWFLPILLVCIVISIPWYRTPGESGAIIAGLPTWVWTSLACAAGVAVLTAIGTLLFWKDPDDE
ncbi:MAG: hypothetical protein VCB26_14725 [Candidatus Hydrogenedentota bacterium]|jgi:hypothetical protein